MTAGEPSLSRRFRDHFLVGCAVGGTLPESLAEHERAALLQHFGGLTPENCMKPIHVHPEPDRYDFGPGDALVGFAKENDMQVVGHTLCWHQQSPGWFFDGKTTQQSLALLHEHVATVVEHYRGDVHGWDVVNEGIADSGEYLRDTPWYRTLGEDYVVEAFDIAHQADPDVRLYYNDYNLERPDKRQRALRLLRTLLERGRRVDGVGIQGHWVSGQVPFEDIEAAIEAYAELGLEVMFTELDLDVIERPDCGADLDAQQAYDPGVDIYRDGAPPEVLQRQADEYARLFQLFASHPAVTRVTLWGLHDGLSWLNHWPAKRTNHPLLFDRHCAPKPALKRLLGVND